MFHKAYLIFEWERDVCVKFFLFCFPKGALRQYNYTTRCLSCSNLPCRITLPRGRVPLVDPF